MRHDVCRRDLRYTAWVSLRGYFPMKHLFFAAGLLLISTFSGWISPAWALIPVVPFSPSEFVDVATQPYGCGLSCQTNTQMIGNGGQNLSVTSPVPSATASIVLPSAGLPDLSVSVSNEPGISVSADASYINTIRFVYTGAGTPPASLSSSIAWTVNGTVQAPTGTPSYEIGGYSSIAISLSTCYCPFQFVSNDIVQSGSTSLDNPFTIANGGTIAYEVNVGANIFGVPGLTGSVSLDPEIEIGLPSGWTGYLGSGGTLGGPLVVPSPEPPTLLLWGTFLAAWILARIPARFQHSRVF